MALINKGKDILTIIEIKNIIVPLLNKHNINEIYLFGSYAKGTANINSDIDIYCEQGNVDTYIKLEAIYEELESA